MYMAINDCDWQNAIYKQVASSTNSACGLQRFYNQQTSLVKTHCQTNLSCANADAYM